MNDILLVESDCCTLYLETSEYVYDATFDVRDLCSRDS